MKRNLNCLFLCLVVFGLVIFPAFAGGAKESASPGQAIGGPETIPVSVFWIQETQADQGQKLLARSKGEGDLGLYRGFSYQKNGDSFQWTQNSSLTAVGLRSRQHDSGNPDWVLVELYGTAKTSPLAAGGKTLTVRLGINEMITEAKKGGGVSLSRLLPQILKKSLKNGKGVVSLLSCTWNAAELSIEATCLVTE